MVISQSSDNRTLLPLIYIRNLRPRAKRKQPLILVETIQHFSRNMAGKRDTVHVVASIGQLRKADYSVGIDEVIGKLIDHKQRLVL